MLSLLFPSSGAMLVGGPLVELGPALERFVRPGARMAITGRLAGQADEVISAWSGWADMTVGDRVQDWVLLTGTKCGTGDSETED